MAEDKTIYDEQWFIVPPPWDHSGCIICSGSEDPNQGLVIQNTASIDIMDEEDGQQLAEYIVNLHNSSLKQKAEKFIVKRVYRYGELENEIKQMYDDRLWNNLKEEFKLNCSSYKETDNGFSVDDEQEDVKWSYHYSIEENQYSPSKAMPPPE